MRIPNEVHEAQPWRIHEVARDFRLEDVWALPAHGGTDDFRALLDAMWSLDPANAESRAARFLWRLRDRLGAWFSIGRISTPAEDPGSRFEALPFVTLYETGDEFAAKISNRTVQALMHLAWVPDGEDRYHGQMAVYVKPRGLFGQAYMAAIKPFRHWIVYPALMGELERKWSARAR